MKRKILFTAVFLLLHSMLSAGKKGDNNTVFHAVVAQDGSGNYLTVQSAIDAAPEGRKEPWRIYVRQGLYKEHVEIPASKPFISLIGEGRDKTQISSDGLSGGPTSVGVDKGATVTAKASDLYFEGINFINSHGHEQKSGPQALALYTQGDRVALNRCGLLSFQDTWLTPCHKPNLRNYSVNCFIEGAVDFIYGQGNIFFDHDTLYITRKKGGYIVAPNHHPDTEWGYVFNHNVITAPGDAIETKVYLGRPWHAKPKVAFINTKAEVTIYESGWHNHMGGLPTMFAEYGTTDWLGHTIDLSKRCSRYWIQDEQKDTVWCTSKAVITADEAALYTVENVLSGKDMWNPKQTVTPCGTPVTGTSGKYLVWQPVAGAVGYVVTINGKIKKYITDCRIAYKKKNTYRVQSVSRWGALSE